MTTEHTRPTQREILDGIAAKQARRPRVDNNGHPIDRQTGRKYDSHGRLVRPAPAEGDGA